MNRTVLILALLVLLSASTQAQTVTTAPTVTGAPAALACPALQFEGLKPGEGRLMIAAYGSAESFFKKPVWSQTVTVDKETMRVPVCDLDSSEIAVMAFQDMNGNGKLDSNPMGIPSEPYAASGSPAMFSAPTWQDTKVSFAGATKPIVVKF